ncbi:nucleic acid-binding protein [Neolentinus lepideus HHB14362 ss-1]|uniref:Nucleic acid-binding protein n=1 Tax=Neolentinus lepideus HHB14362 ss-1 TaxID=1314782 RepID=A0A165TDR4_9AGAM|nr:nucleic acid-binding protein [Neolentinus lepideus HHB14362 ss-1]
MSGETSFSDEGFTGVAGSIPNEEFDQYVVRPVTIHQVLSATRAHAHAKFKIDGVEVVNVTIVAHVVDLDTSQETCNIFQLEDGSRGGRISARQWNADIPGTDDDPAGVCDITAHSYVRLFGVLTQYNGKNYLPVKHIRRVTEPMEIYFHLLQCTYVTLFYRKGPPPFQAAEYPEESFHVTDGDGTPGSSRVADKSPDGRQSSALSASQDIPRTTQSLGIVRGSHPLPLKAETSISSEAEMQRNMTVDSEATAHHSSERIGETISRSLVSGEVNRSDRVEEETSQYSQDDPTSRLASLSLWDDSELFASTPASHSDVVTCDDQVDSFRQPSSSREQALSPDP